MVVSGAGAVEEYRGSVTMFVTLKPPSIKICYDLQVGQKLQMRDPDKHVTSLYQTWITVTRTKTQKGCAKIKIFLSIAPSPTLFISVQYSRSQARGSQARLPSPLLLGWRQTGE